MILSPEIGVRVSSFGYHQVKVEVERVSLSPKASIRQWREAG